MYRTGFLSIIRSLVLHTQQQVYVTQYETPDDGQKTCPKHVDFNSKNKLEKFVHLIGFIIRMKHLPPMYYRGTKTTVLFTVVSANF